MNSVRERKKYNKLFEVTFKEKPQLSESKRRNRV